MRQCHAHDGALRIDEGRAIAAHLAGGGRALLCLVVGRDADKRIGWRWDELRLVQVGIHLVHRGMLLVGRRAERRLGMRLDTDCDGICIVD